MSSVSVWIWRRDSEGIDHVIEAQTELCRTSEDFVLVSTQAVTLNDRGMMQAGCITPRRATISSGRKRAPTPEATWKLAWSRSWRIPYYGNTYVPGEESE